MTELKKPKSEDESERGHWGSRAEFLLSCIGFSVGLGNVWRFPFLAYENGGGAFLIPYIILLVLVGKPMYFMEAALGQFGQVGPLQVWTEMLPCAIGVGLAMVVLSLIVSIYYNVIMAYCLMYLFNSFQEVLPWTWCDPQWADDKCFVRSYNNTMLDSSEKKQISEEQFWERRVLDITRDGLAESGHLGQVKVELAFYLLLSWLAVLLCLSKGIKSSGKVVYFTATFPYVVLLVLLCLGVSLPGADLGLYYLFVPKWEKLADFSVWRKAAGQVFFSLGLSFGGIIMFGSYNKFNARVHVDAHIISLVDFLTSLIACIVIFSTLGHSAYNLGVPVESVAKGGQGLAFVVYPEALSHLPAPHFWSIIFFLMLFFLGLDSQFAVFETVLVGLFDAFPSWRSQKFEITSAVCGLFFLLGLPLVTQSGQYILDLMDTYGVSLPILLVAVIELVVIMLGYGANNFCKDIESMLGYYPGWYFKICWIVVSPLVLLAIFLSSVIDWTKPSYGPLEYPEWAHSLGIFLALVSLIQIPIWFVIVITLYYFKKVNIDSPWTCAQTWLDRRDSSEVVTNISCLHENFNPTRMSSQRAENEYESSYKYNKKMTSSISSGSVNSYRGTSELDPGTPSVGSKHILI